MHTLSVTRLPPAVSRLELGGVYLLAHEPLPLFQSLIWGLLLQAAQLAQALWIGRRNPEPDVVATGALQTRLRSAIDAGKLRLFTCSDQLPKSASLAQTLLADLEFFAPSRNSLVLIEQVEALLPADRTPAELNAVLLPFKRWAEEHQLVLLLCYSTPLVDSLQSLPLFKGQSTLAGVSFLSRAGFQVIFHAQYWLTLEEGFATARRYRLAVDPEGMVQVEDELAQFTSSDSRQVIQELVLITRTALMDRVLPPGWRMLESNADFLQESADHTDSVFILHYDRQTDLLDLTTIVYQLRRRFGLHVRIVVREINTQLRYGQVHVLLTAGANMVIPSLLSFSHLRGMLEGLMGHIFSRPLVDKLENVLLLLQPTRYLGLVSIPQFVEAVTKTLELHQLMPVQDVLVVLPIAKGLPFSQVAQALTLTREGDLCTHAGGWLYLFFSACHEENITLALERAFQVSYMELFDGETRYSSKAAIKHQINDLATQEHLSPLLDTLDPLAALEEEPQSKLSPAEKLLLPSAAKPRPIALRPEPQVATSTLGLARR